MAISTLLAKSFQLSILTTALLVAGCGGNDNLIPPGVGATSGGSASGSTGGTTSGGAGATTVAQLNVTNIVLQDSTGKEIVDNSVSKDGAILKVKVVNADGAAVANAKVAFSVDGAGLILNQPTSGAVLTDKNGETSISFRPENPSVTGAYTIGVSVTDDQGQTANASKTFSVSPSNAKLKDFNADKIQLESGESALLSVKVVDANDKVLSGIPVNFMATCGQINAYQSSDSNGLVEVSYKSVTANNELCVGAVTLTATIGTTSEKQNIRLEVAKPKATSILYDSQDVTLGIQGSGSSSTGEVSFTVYKDKTPLRGAEVIITAEKAPFDFKFGAVDNQGPITLRSDDQGKVTVNLYPGQTPGPVELKAALKDSNTVFALSKNINVASARVSQDGFSLSVEQNVLEGATIDGVTTTLTARLVDRNSNPVPDGTVVSFTASSGKIQSSCRTANGECNVTYTTQNPRTENGRVNILAVVEGEKAFIDANRNNMWDVGEKFKLNIGDAFRDDNENGKFDIGEFIYLARTGGVKGACNDAGIKFINESAIRIPNMPGTCSDGLDAILRQQIQLVLSTSDVAITTPVNKRHKVTVQLNATNNPNNPMPSGTKIEATAIKGDGNDAKCEMYFQEGDTTIPNVLPLKKPTDQLGTQHTFNLKGCMANDILEIKVTTPSGRETKYLHKIK